MERVIGCRRGDHGVRLAGRRHHDRHRRDGDRLAGVGSHTLTLTVTDDGGATDSDTVEVNIADGNEPPTADAGPDQELADADGSGDEDVALDGTGSSDDDGSITEYRWQEGDTTLATEATATVSLGVGSHTLILTVTDDGGQPIATRSSSSSPPTRRRARMPGPT